MHKINFIPPLVIEILKASLGMPDHTQLNLQNQCIALIEMQVHTQNQIYTSFKCLRSYKF